MSNSEEQVQHPSWYGGKEDVYETIKVMKAKASPREYIGFLKLQVMKYNDRATKKGTEFTDYRKALFYQQELVQFMLECDTNGIDTSR